MFEQVTIGLRMQARGRATKYLGSLDQGSDEYGGGAARISSCEGEGSKNEGWLDCLSSFPCSSWSKFLVH